MSRLTCVRLIHRECSSRALVFNPIRQKEETWRYVVGGKQMIKTFPIFTRSLHTTNLILNKEVEPKPIELVGDNFVQRLYKKMFRGVPKSKLKASGYILLTHCVQLQQLDKFFRVFDMPDTFYSWFLVSELHVWMLCARLMNEGDYGRIVRNAMVEALWQDCDQRAKSIGDMAGSARSKQILAISEEFQAALFVYDEGLLGSDQELANALWRRFFLSMRNSEEKQVPDMEKIALLVDYVRRTMNHLDNTDAVTLLMKGQVSWLQLNESISARS